MFLLIFLSHGPKCLLEFSLGSKLAFFLIFLFPFKTNHGKGSLSNAGEGWASQTGKALLF